MSGTDGRQTRLRRAWVVGSLCGAVLYAIMLVGAEWRSQLPFIGEQVYNYYFMALRNGDLSVPVQIIGLEGHYDASGRAMVYHGLAPLITRAFAFPFIDLAQTDMRLPTIWLFATLGSTIFYALLLNLAGLARPGLEGLAPALSLVVWAMVWLCGGGAILAMNGSFFHEPLGVAFAAQGAVLLCLYHLHSGGFRRGALLVLMAILAGISVHARPHVAVGLYLAVVICATLMLYQRPRQALAPVAIAMLVLGAFGVLYLWANLLRFGGVATVDAGMGDVGEIAYGFVFWGEEALNSPRRVAVEQYGRFHIARILPNVMFYHVGLGEIWSQEAFSRFTAHVGDIRTEFPKVGFLFLWPVWIYLAVSMVARRGSSGAVFWIAVLALLPGTILVYAYPTITMRYRVELWTVYFIIGAFGLRAVLALSAEQVEREMGRLKVLILIGAGFAVFTYALYSDHINWAWGIKLRSYADCAEAVTAHELLGPDRVADICVIGAPS